MKKYNYKIVNLDCAACAKKIEDRLNKDNNLHNVIINYATSRISYETDLEDAVTLINKIIDKIEPGVKVQKEESVKKNYDIYLLILVILIFLIMKYFYILHILLYYLNHLL